MRISILPNLFFHCALMLILASLSGCAYTQLTALPKGGTEVDPSGEVSSVQQAGLILRAQQTDPPRSARNELTAFAITIINPNEEPMPFIAKEILLIDQYNRQYYALGPEALLETADQGSNYRYSVGLANVWGHSTFATRGYFGYHYGYPWYDPFYYHHHRHDHYQGILAKALPREPIEVQPNATVTGNVYFPVPASEIGISQLRLTRFLSRPKPEAPQPQEITATFYFAPKE